MRRPGEKQVEMIFYKTLEHVQVRIVKRIENPDEKTFFLDVNSLPSYSNGIAS